MQMIDRRRALRYLGLVVVFGAGWRSARADNPEDGMTQAGYNRITRTENSVTGNPPNDPKVPVTPIHNLGQTEKRDMKRQGHAAKMIDGETWKAESPEERDAHLRRLKETAPAGTTFFIEVPSGNIWQLPPQDAETAEYLKRYVYREWLKYEIEAMPVAVLPEGTSHTDSRGTTIVRTIAIQQKF
jgi:hypothetical protein